MAAKSWRITPPFFDSTDDFTDYVDNVTGATPYAMAILAGLQDQPHVYQGTVDPVVVADRRAKNRHARRARRGNTAAIAKQSRANRRLNLATKRGALGFGRRRVISLDGISPLIDAEVVEE